MFQHIGIAEWDIFDNVVLILLTALYACAWLVENLQNVRLHEIK